MNSQQLVNFEVVDETEAAELKIDGKVVISRSTVIRRWGQETVKVIVDELTGVIRRRTSNETKDTNESTAKSQ